MKHRVVTGAALALAYILVGHAGIAFTSLPPGNLTLVWLCSGIGLVAFVRLGTTAFGWIMAASFAVNGPPLVESGRFALPMAVALSLTAASVDALQSWLAWRAAVWVAKRNARPLLSSSADTGAFLGYVCLAPSVATCWFLVLVPAWFAPEPFSSAVLAPRIAQLTVADALGLLTLGPVAFDNAAYSHPPGGRWERLGLLLLPLCPVAASLWAMSSAVFFTLPALAFSSSRLSLREASLAGTGVVIVAAWGTGRGLGFFGQHGRPEPFFDLAVLTLCVLFVQLYLVLLAADRRVDHARLEREVADKTHALDEVKQMSRRILAIQEEERTRVGRELHDGLGQLLASVAFRLKALRPEGSTGVAAELVTMGEHLHRAIDETRRMSQALHPAVIDDLGLEAACRAVCRELKTTTGAAVRFQCSMHTDPARHVQSAIYRVLQEALRNVEKHACAHSVAVTLETSDQKTRLEVRDDGVGFDPESVPGDGARARLGLRNMQDRARALGGHCTITSRPDKGTTLSLTIPSA